MKTPQFITFTGADEHTDIDRMVELSRRYPIEWGILFSPKRQGAGRYPPRDFARQLTDRGDLRLSAHLCGGHSRDVIALGRVPLSLDGFLRAQINSAEPGIDAQQVMRWGERLGVQPILQCRGDFPSPSPVRWLFDQSGGRGVPAAWWPSQPSTTDLCGYAGGITPANVINMLSRIEASRFWIDMESGVRDEADRFDLGKCEAVCRAVYGEVAR